MIGLDSARRFVVFLVLFAGGMGVLVWQAGGLRGRTHTRIAGQTGVSGRGPGPVVDLQDGASMGRGEGVRIERDGVEVVDGVAYEYRAFEAAWATQEPRKARAPGQRRLHVTECNILLFHERPTRERPRPPAIEGPGTTHIRADVADVTIREQQQFSAELAGDVVVTRHDEQGDLVLVSDSLDIDAEESRAVTNDPVRITGRGASLQGTGLDADLQEPRATITKNVRGEFLAERGALTSEGGSQDGETTKTVVTCDGVAELRALSEPTPQTGRRWLATFHDNVVVHDGSTSLTCDQLEVEFQMAEGPSGDTGEKRDSVQVLRVVADGNVRMDASRDGDRFVVEAGRSISTQEPGGGRQVLLEGGCRMDFTGRIRARRAGEPEQGRIEIRCKGPAALYYEPPVAGSTAPLRARAVFEQDVVARQWPPDDGPVESEIRAPLLTLFGTQAEGGRLDPQAMTAHGNETQRVHIRRRGLAAQARVASWETLPEELMERLTLTGDPVATFEDRSGLNPLGSGSRGADATLVVSAKEEIVVVYPREMQPGASPAPGQDGATASARGNVVARRIIGETEMYRLRADRADVEFAPDRRPRQMHAYGDVVLLGRGEREGQRSAELRGSRLRANAAAATGVDDPWTEATVIVFGEPQKPAIAIVEEVPDAKGIRRSHSVRAQELSYGESGTVIVARGAAEAALNSSADPGSGIDAKDPYSGPVHIRADDIRAELFPARPDDASARRPNLRRVVATGGVTVEGETHRVSGDRTTYDHVNGVAIVTGRPARAAYRHAERLALAAPVSTITSPTIRADFDVRAQGDGRMKRVSCTGGKIVGFRFPEPGPRGAVAPPRRITVTGTGPMTMDDRRATASGNVDVVYESQTPRGGWQRDAHLECERIELGFDPNASGALRDRIARAYATGTAQRPVRVVTPKFEATADVVEGLGDWLHLRANPGRHVHVTERDPIRQFFCDSGSWNVRTFAWENFIRFRVR